MTQTARDESRCRRAVLVSIVVAYAALLLALAQVGKANERVKYDSHTHHLPLILDFARQWPTPDLHDYAVASTPGYHLVLSLFARAVSANETALRSAGAVFTLLLVGTVAWALRCRWSTIALGLPLLMSPYVLSSGIWVLPENAAWWLVVLTLGLCLRPKLDGGTLVVLAVALAFMVLIRQTTVWMIPVTLLAVAMAPEMSLKHRAVAAASVLPALGVLLAFLLLWKGLTPPMFQPGAPPRPENLEVILYGKFSLTPPGFTLVLLAIFGLFFVPFFDFKRMTDRWWTLGLAGGAILGVLTPSNYAFPVRRSGVWRFIQAAPTFFDRSLLFVALAAVGGGFVVLILRSLPARPRWILGAALFFFVASQLNNPMIWQRYYEPFVLIFLALAAYHAGREPTAKRLAGPLVLSAGLLLVFVAILLGYIGGEGS